MRFEFQGRPVVFAHRQAGKPCMYASGQPVLFNDMFQGPDGTKP